MLFVPSFFRNKGAVAGVFVVVGLAATAIVFFVLFWFRRRRKTRELDHDTAVAATLAEHGYGRQNLIDADDDQPVSALRTVTPPSGSGNSSDRRTSTPSMTMGGFGTGPVSTGGYGRQSHSPSYPVDSLGQTYNPYTDNQVPYHDVNHGMTNPSEMSKYSLPSGSGTIGRPFFGHGPNDSLGSSEPLLGSSGRGTPPEPPTPAVPPRNPLRLLGGPGSEHDHDDVYGGLDDGSGGYKDGDDFEYEAFRKRSLKVRSGSICRSDISLRVLIIGVRSETTQSDLTSLK